MIILAAGQRRMAVESRPELVEGIDYSWYEQVPMGPRDLIWRDGRWVDRRTTDGEVLAADGRNRL